MLTLQDIQNDFDHLIGRSKELDIEFQSDLEDLKLAVMHKLRQGAAFETAFDEISDTMEKGLMEIKLMEQNAKQIKENLKK